MDLTDVLALSNLSLLAGGRAEGSPPSPISSVYLFSSLLLTFPKLLCLKLSSLAHLIG